MDALSHGHGPREAYSREWGRLGFSGAIGYRAIRIHNTNLVSQNPLADLQEKQNNKNKQNNLHRNRETFVDYASLEISFRQVLGELVRTSRPRTY